jgi:hypothetical protein
MLYYLVRETKSQTLVHGIIYHPLPADVGIKQHDR